MPDSMIDNALRSFRKKVEIHDRIHYRRDGAPISIESQIIDVSLEDHNLLIVK